MHKEKIKIGISHGDVNGIGYEIILKTLVDSRITEMCTPIVYGSAKIAAYYRKALNIENFNLNLINDADESNPKRANIINCIDESVRVEIGKSTTHAGKVAYEALNHAMHDLKSGKIDVLVTAPINKHNIQSEEFNFPGHTEYLENQFTDAKSLMIMVSDSMRIGVLTGHIALKDVPAMITEENILSKLSLMNKSLIVDFNIRKPKIAVFGLNPHAGDEGVIGNEEKDIIIPAIQKANEQGILAFGPFPSDGFFGSENLNKFDGILAMYHDQGLTPFKAISFENGVNFTAGLPIIRTSPGHGTAYEIAGENKANPASFRQAIYQAIDIYRNREMHAELSENPLKSFKDKVSSHNTKDEDVAKMGLSE